MVAVQELLRLLRKALELIGTALALTGYKWPSPAIVQNGAKYDYVVVGAGTAGCIVATRLAEDEKVTVLLVEAGVDPPLESELAGLFALLPRSVHDWNIESLNDTRVAQYTKNKTQLLTAGKMLGGSSSLNHLVYTRGHPQDYNDLARITNDDSWSYKNMLKYMKKPENLVVKEILESENGKLYGTGGYVSLTREHEEINEKILNAFDEVGKKRVIDTNGLDILGYTEPVLIISEDGVRQSTAESYLRRVKNKPNIHVLKNTKVTKVIFDDCKNAIGVVARNKTRTFKVFSTKEVILCAGAFNTPKILMLSGVGPKDQLRKFDIEVISNLPVGKNLQDHTAVILAQQLGPISVTEEPRDPRKFPSPLTLGYAAVNKRQKVPDYVTVNLFVSNSTVRELSAALFDFKDDISEAWYNASNGHELLLTAVSMLHPKSRGSVELSGVNYDDPLSVYLNSLSNDQDLTNMARYLDDYIQVQKSTYFKSVGANLVNVNIGCDGIEDSLEFWKCYANALGYTFWNFCGTCSMEKVVDNKLKVKGVGKLRVVDASVISKIPSAYTNAPVMAIAEKAADLIKRETY